MTDLYNFSVNYEQIGYVIKLVEAATSKVKRFFIAGAYTDFAQRQLESHMESLTDTLCEQWFRPEKQKKEKKS
jgi:hypothetical protein